MPRYIKDDKYFEAVTIGWRVLSGTGTIGKKPRKSRKEFDDEADAAKGLEKMLAKREKAGFARVQEGIEALSEMVLAECLSNKEELARMIEAGIDLSVAEPDGWTYLHETLADHDVETAALLLKGGARPDAALSSGHDHAHDSYKKGVKPLDMARDVARTLKRHEAPEQHVAQAQALVKHMGDVCAEGPPSPERDLEGAGFDASAYGAVVFGRVLEGLSRSAVVSAAERAHGAAIGVYPGGDLGDTRAVEDDSADAGIPVCVGRCLVISEADDGRPAPVPQASTDDGASLAEVDEFLADLNGTPSERAGLWLVAGGSLASAVLVAGELLAKKPADGRWHRGSTMQQAAHSAGVRGRVLASSEDVSPIEVELDRADSVYLIARYD